jgi:hypothetical protein
MKKTTIAILSLVLLSGYSVLGQGTIFFGNRLSASTFVPVYMADGTTPVTGPNFSAQLYAQLGGSFTAVGNPIVFRSPGAANGSWAGATVAIPGAAPGTTVQLEVRAWANSFSSYDAAVAGGGLYGLSPIFTSGQLGGDPGGGGLPITDPNIVGNATAINNMQSFNLVPEPSTIALGVLGIGALLLRRRK